MCTHEGAVFYNVYDAGGPGTSPPHPIQRSRHPSTPNPPPLFYVGGHGGGQLSKFWGRPTAALEVLGPTVAGSVVLGAARRGLHWHDSLRPTLHVAVPHWTVVSPRAEYWYAQDAEPVVGSRIGTSYYGSPTNGLLNPAATCPLTSDGQGRRVSPLIPTAFALIARAPAV